MRLASPEKTLFIINRQFVQNCGTHCDLSLLFVIACDARFPLNTQSGAYGDRAAADNNLRSRCPTVKKKSFLQLKYVVKNDQDTKEEVMPLAAIK